MIPTDSSGTQRGAWLKSVGSYFAANDAAFVTYFNSIGVSNADYRLMDSPSVGGWANVILNN